MAIFNSYVSHYQRVKPVANHCSLPVVRSMATRPALSTAEIEALRIHEENHPSLGGFKGHVLDFFWVTDPLCGVLNPSLSHWLAAAVADCIGFGVMIGDIRRWTCSCQWVTIPYPQKQVPQIWVQKCFFAASFTSITLMGSWAPNDASDCWRYTGWTQVRRVGEILWEEAPSKAWEDHTNRSLQKFGQKSQRKLIDPTLNQNCDTHEEESW